MSIVAMATSWALCQGIMVALSSLGRTCERLAVPGLPGSRQAQAAVTIVPMPTTALSSCRPVRRIRVLRQL
jgi:hypothetical protein